MNVKCSPELLAQAKAALAPYKAQVPQRHTLLEASDLATPFTITQYGQWAANIPPLSPEDAARCVSADELLVRIANGTA